MKKECKRTLRALKERKRIMCSEHKIMLCPTLPRTLLPSFSPPPCLTADQIRIRILAWRSRRHLRHRDNILKPRSYCNCFVTFSLYTCMLCGIFAWLPRCRAVIMLKNVACPAYTIRKLNHPPQTSN